MAADHTPLEKKTTLPTLAKLLRGPDKEIWSHSTANEFGRLLPNGIGMNRPAAERIQGTSTMYPIPKSKIPPGRKATYANFIPAIRPNKAETHRVRLCAGGDKLDYPDDPSSPAVSVTNAKLHINSTISDAKKGAKYLVLDIKIFYLGNKLTYFQYIRVHMSMIPREVLDEYGLTAEADGFVYFEVRKGIYGLKEAGLIAFKQLVTNLAPFGYVPMKYTPGLWRHQTKPTTFALCVDDFGVKYFSKPDALHLIQALKTNYEITIDWTGNAYCGLDLEWNYQKGFVDVSMKGYVKRALTRFQHVPSSTRTQHAPHPWSQPSYGRSSPQQPTTTPSAPPLDATATRRIQAIAGTFNFYSEVDPCIKPALNEIGTMQAKPTEVTNAKVQMLMDYLHCHPDATLRYHASDMILQFESDAAYLVLPKARSRAAAWFILGQDPTTTSTPMQNAPLHVLCNTIKNVVSSAAEAETGGIFLAAQKACPMRVALAELGHPQPRHGTPVFNDNSTATGILNSSLRQKLSKAFDMRFYWVRDRIEQKHFQLFWRKGSTNMADYFTKHHPPWYHRQMRHKYLHRALLTSRVRGCVTSSCQSSADPHFNVLRHPRLHLPLSNTTNTFHYRPQFSPSLSLN